MAEETEISAPGPAGPLKGLLLTPDDRKARSVALIVPGSGPTDRDGNGPMIKSATYRLLAEGLADHGIASVRIDKRGLFTSAGAVPDADAVSMEDYADDVHCWIDVIKRMIRADCVWLIGHSEGGLVSLMASAKPDSICGLVLLASPGRPPGDILREQMKRFAKTRAVLDQSLSAIAALEAGNRVDATDLDPALAPVFRVGVQGFLISFLAVQPDLLAQSYTGPMLILQGRRDLQVSEADADRLKKANHDAELVLLDNTNHVLKTVTTDDADANMATYVDPHLPLAPGVVEAVARFIGNAAKGRTRTNRMTS